MLWGSCFVCFFSTDKKWEMDETNCRVVMEANLSEAIHLVFAKRGRQKNVSRCVKLVEIPEIPTVVTASVKTFENHVFFFSFCSFTLFNTTRISSTELPQ